MRNHGAERRGWGVSKEHAGCTHIIFESSPDRYSIAARPSYQPAASDSAQGGSAHTVSWGWLLDVGGGGNCTGGIGGLSQCAGATGAVRITFVGLGGLGLARGSSGG